mmetsp:Transcript_27332/g.73911  ORF Transcript_27332/g.73911 Transcript_27332/m.73911 type:complete len:251 (+) Transcript_27332:1531-2283(+)
MMRLQRESTGASLRLRRRRAKRKRVKRRRSKTRKRWRTASPLASSRAWPPATLASPPRCRRASRPQMSASSCVRAMKPSSLSCTRCWSRSRPPWRPAPCWAQTMCMSCLGSRRRGAWSRRCPGGLGPLETWRSRSRQRRWRGWTRADSRHCTSKSWQRCALATNARTSATWWLQRQRSRSARHSRRQTGGRSRRLGRTSNFKQQGGLRTAPMSFSVSVLVYQLEVCWCSSTASSSLMLTFISLTCALLMG